MCVTLSALIGWVGSAARVRNSLTVKRCWAIVDQANPPDITQELGVLLNQTLVRSVHRFGIQPPARDQETLASAACRPVDNDTPCRQVSEPEQFPEPVVGVAHTDTRLAGALEHAP